MHPVKVYRLLGLNQYVCFHKNCEHTLAGLDCEHTVYVYSVKKLIDTGETRPYDNGYEVRDTPLYKDAQGRIYHLRIEVDYYSTPLYARDDDNKVFSTRPKAVREGRRSTDLFGKRITL